MARHLLGDRNFQALLWTQLGGAFNLGLFGSTLVILIAGNGYIFDGLSREAMIALCGGVFIAPFLLFSATAGQLTDRCAKPRLVLWVKLCEVGIMLLATWGFINGAAEVLLGALFLLGVNAAFLVPLRQAISVELVGREKLLEANAWLETGTFGAACLGATVGSLLVKGLEAGPEIIGMAGVGLALLGFLASLALPQRSALTPDLPLPGNLFTATIQVVRATAGDKRVLLPVLGISWFWFVICAILSLLIATCKTPLGLGGSSITLLPVLFAVGIGSGGYLCNRIGGGRLDLGLVPFGSFGISLFAFDLFLAASPDLVLRSQAHGISLPHLLDSAGGLRTILDLFLLSMFSGLYLVPLHTLLQECSGVRERGRVTAAANIFSVLFMIGAAAGLTLLGERDWTFGQVFLFLSLLNLGASIYIYSVVPASVLRLLCWAIARLMYRIKVTGKKHIPVEGGAVLVSNHVSFVDWLLIAGASPRPVRFVMHYQFLRLPLARRFFRDAGVIPIAGAGENPKILVKAFQRIEEVLARGEMVCIFPEGRITDDGNIGEFRRGIERIIGRSPVPVIPIALDGLWGSFFSKKDGKPMTRPFRRIWSRLRLIIGEALPPAEISAEHLRAIIAALSAQGDNSERTTVIQPRT